MNKRESKRDQQSSVSRIYDLICEIERNKVHARVDVRLNIELDLKAKEIERLSLNMKDRWLINNLGGP